MKLKQSFYISLLILSTFQISVSNAESYCSGTLVYACPSNSSTGKCINTGTYWSNGKYDYQCTNTSSICSGVTCTPPPISGAPACTGTQLSGSSVSSNSCSNASTSPTYWCTGSACYQTTNVSDVGCGGVLCTV